METQGEPVGDGDATADEDQQDAGEVARIRRWRTPALAFAAVGLGLVGLGVFIGWVALGRIGPSDAQVEVVEKPIADYTVGLAVMPDLRGLPEKTARTALTDAGIPASALTVESRPAAGVVGLVVEQDPGFGTENPSSVALTISSKAAMPDVSGMSEADATTTLTELGARVETERQYRAGTAPGMALGTKPAAGKKVGESATLYVSEPASSVYLSQLDTISYPGCDSTDFVVVAGTEHDNGVVCEADDETERYTWRLSRKVQSLETTVGISDEADPAAAAAYEIRGDGKLLAEGTTTFGSPSKVLVDVSDVIQLQLRVKATGKVPDGADVEVVLADARLTGSSAGIDKLLEWAS